MASSRARPAARSPLSRPPAPAKRRRTRSACLPGGRGALRIPTRRVAYADEHDRHRRRRVSRGHGRGRTEGHDHSRLKPQQFQGRGWREIPIPVREPVLEQEIVTFVVPEPSRIFAGGRRAMQQLIPSGGFEGQQSDAGPVPRLLRHTGDRRGQEGDKQGRRPASRNLPLARCYDESRRWSTAGGQLRFAPGSAPPAAGATRR